jgi:transglutaminase-like putative cysteine protease
MEIYPTPVGYNEHLDLEGNRVTQIWFEGVTGQFDINVTMEVETFQHNDLSFPLSPEASTLPINHQHDLICARAYLERSNPDDAVTAFAAELSVSVNRDTINFLERLNQHLFTEFTQIHRHTGDPQSPTMTLQSHQGACRDLAVLFVDCCRAEGIAARFVSGYQKGDIQSEQRHLHAWPEVYLPRAGWHGFDPTHGKRVRGTHVGVAAAAHPRDTMPVIGNFSGSATSSLSYSVQIQVN